jgi:SAM-dependent methyltransferase
MAPSPLIITSDVIAFVRSSLPEPPCTVLEIGAGRGELASELRSIGYDLTAIDPRDDPGPGVEQLALLDASGTFDAAVAVVSLHHVEPLEESCAHLASLLSPEAPLVIDEIDVARYDERATGWWIAQRRALGAGTGDHDPAEILEKLRNHIHALDEVMAALAPHFELGQPVRGPYLHRWELSESLREVEVELIAGGHLPPTGARLIGIRCR